MGEAPVGGPGPQISIGSPCMCRTAIFVIFPQCAHRARVGADVEVAKTIIRLLHLSQVSLCVVTMMLSNAHRETSCRAIAKLPSYSLLAGRGDALCCAWWRSALA